MGLFCINPYDKSPKAQLQCALGNLELYVGSLRANDDQPLDYLLGFIEKQIKDSILEIEKSTN